MQQQPPQQAPGQPGPQQEAARTLPLQSDPGPERAEMVSTGTHTVPIGQRPPAKVCSSLQYYSVALQDKLGMPQIWFFYP